MGYFGSFYRDRGYLRLSIRFDDHSQAVSTKLIDLENKLKEKVKWYTNQ